MKITVLMEDTAPDGFIAEHGLSLYIEYNDKNYLLDAGKTGAFLENAGRLGVSIEAIDTAFLSHAHYDHADGFETFFENNQNAKLYLSSNCKENCYSTGKDTDFRYIGIKEGILEENKNRIILAKGMTRVEEGIYLIPHTTPGLEQIGERSALFQKNEDKMEADDFCHEQSLVFETKKGLVIFNSCSHGRVDHIVDEVQTVFPNQKTYAFIGGFHLVKMPEEYVREYAKKIHGYEITVIYTGHCTGKEAYDILKMELGDSLHRLMTGKKILIP